MCGISAFLLKKKINNSIHIMIDSLKQLQNRGYDSLGIGYIEKGSISNYKKIKPDCFDIINEDCKNIDSNIYIGHTRWATHGGISVKNTHPHNSNNNKFSLVHNGIIENYKSLKKELLQNNYTFNSETDTEIIVNLIDFYYNQKNDIIESIKLVMTRLEGTFGIALITSHDMENIYLFKKGSPLLIAYNDQYVFATSEISGFNNLFNNYVFLNNNQICILNKKNNIIIHDITESKQVVLKENIIEKNKLTSTIPSPFKHWTEKEIYEQDNSLLRSINNGARINKNKIKLGGLEKLTKIIKKNIEKHLIILGCGTSYHAGLVSLHYFKQFKSFSSFQCFDGAEFEPHDIPSSGETYIIFCSQSGETYDLIRCLEIAKNNNCITIGAINVVDSTISREVFCGVYLNCGREVAVASTKSFTSMLVVLKLISLWFYQETNLNLINLNTEIEIIRTTINNISNIYKLKTQHFLDKLNQSSLFILGKGKLENIAKEAALKIKETCYIHAEGYSGSALKHGPFALLEKDIPVIFLINNKYKNKMLNAYEEVKSRNAYCLVITNVKNLTIENCIYIDCEDNYEEIPFIILLQIISYNLSLKKNINPDKPRNLAKVVTVE